MRLVPIKERVWMGVDKGYRLTKVGEEWVCDHCIWKGNASLGALLKEIIKKANKEKSDENLNHDL